MNGHVAFLVGRMNPPTPGHIALINELISFSKQINAKPKAYITLSNNEKKMNKTQKATLIEGLSKQKTGASIVKPYVKNPGYENPLMPEQKKMYIQQMLFNKYGIEPEESNEIIVIDDKCNGIFKALICAKKEQDDPDKLYFVMGREIDESEREGRETYCLNKSSGQTVIQDEKGMKVKCHFLERTEDDSVAGLSGSKVRLLAANNDYRKLYDVYDGYLEKEQVDNLISDIRSGLHMEEIEKITAIEGKSPKSSKSVVSKSTRKRARNNSNNSGNANSSNNVSDGYKNKKPRTSKTTSESKVSRSTVKAKSTNKNSGNKGGGRRCRSIKNRKRK